MVDRFLNWLTTGKDSSLGSKFVKSIKLIFQILELYVQDTRDPVISLGEYSVLNDKWIKLPRKRRANFDQAATKLKYKKLYKLAEFAYKSDDIDKIEKVLKTIRRYRRSGLNKNGEFGPENLAYKALRTKNVIQKLYDKIEELHSTKLSLPESVNPQKSNNNVSISIFNHRLYVAFRAGPTHFASKKAGMYIISSGDGKTWKKEMEILMLIFGYLYLIDLSQIQIL